MAKQNAGCLSQFSLRWHVFTAWYVGLALLLIPATPPLAAMVDEGPPVLFPKSVDVRRNVVSESFQSFVNTIDEFFGSERILEESRGSYFKISVYTTYREGGENDLKGNVYAKVALPRTEERLKLLLASDEDLEKSESETTASELAATGKEPEAAQTAALRYVLRETPVWNIHADAGIRFRGGVDLFTRYRIRRSIPLGSWAFHFAETFFWYESQGVGALTHIDFSLPIPEKNLFRATSEATWLHDEQAFNLLQRVELLHRISDRRSVIYQASAFGLSEPTEHITATRLTIRLRQAIHRDWVYFEIKPQIDYEKERDFAADKSVTFQLDAIF